MPCKRWTAILLFRMSKLKNSTQVPFIVSIFRSERKWGLPRTDQTHYAFTWVLATKRIELLVVMQFSCEITSYANSSTSRAFKASNSSMRLRSSCTFRLCPSCIFFVVFLMKLSTGPFLEVAHPVIESVKSCLPACPFIASRFRCLIARSVSLGFIEVVRNSRWKRVCEVSKGE